MLCLSKKSPKINVKQVKKNALKKLNFANYWENSNIDKTFVLTAYVSYSSQFWKSAWILSDSKKGDFLVYCLYSNELP